MTRDREPERPSGLAHPAVQATILNELLDSATIGILAVDEGRYVAANRYACELTGYDREELVGRRVGELNPQSGLPEQFLQVLDGSRDSGEIVIRRKDGTEVRICYRAVPTRLAGMRLYLGIFWPV
jgi:PAS domain S-box-containing protein